METRWLFAAGLIGQYYGDTTLTKLDLTRTDATVNFQWGTAAPDPTVPADNFSARWVGQVSAVSPSPSYTFSVMTDGGTRLYVNNQLVINHWSVSTSGQVLYSSSPVSLTTGTKYNLRLEFFSTTGAADIALRWQSKVVPLSVIPTSSLSTTYLDTTAPSTPTGLAASDTTATGTTLSWTASTDDVGVASYDVLRNNVKIASTATTSFTDSGLFPNTNYSYKVDARDAAGNVSPFSNNASAKTLAADTTAPTAPTALSVTNATMTTLAIAWNASTDNVGVVRYDIYRNGVKVGSSTTTNYTDSGLTLATSYTYTVTAADAAGNVSPASAALVASTAPDSQPPTAPTGLTKTGSTMTTLALGWTAATDNIGVVGYEIYRNGVALGPSTTTSYIDTGLSPGTSYTYTVTAADAAGNVSPASAALIASTAPDTQPPTAPTKLAAVPGNAQVTLTWSPSVNAASYTVKRGTASGAETPLDNGTTTSTSFTDSTALIGTTYYYTVVANNSFGSSAASNEVLATPSGATGTGALGGSDAAAPALTNLTALGTVNWSHWGDSTTPISMSGVTPINFTPIGSATLQTWPTVADAFSWSNGTPTANASGDATTIYSSGLNTGYQLVVPADTQQRTVSLFVGAYAATGQLTATLSDGSASPYVATLDSTNTSVSTFNVYTITYQAGSAGQSLTLQWVQANMYVSGGNIGIEALALSASLPAPTGLMETSATLTTLGLAWTASPDDVGVVRYDIYRDGTNVGSSTTTAFTDSELTPGTSYDYTVIAADAAGNLSAPSDAFPAATLADITPPSVPTGLAVSNLTDSSLILSWSAASDDVGVTLYDVYRDGAYAGSTNSLSLADSGLSASTSYTYTVDAQDAAGNISAPSQGLVVTTSPVPDAQPPTAPTGLNQTNATDTTTTLAWDLASDNVGVVGYDVYRDGVEVGSTFTTGYTDSGLSPSTSYTYNVTALDAAGNVSAASDPFTAATAPDMQPPTDPQSLSAADVTFSSLTLSWSPATDDVGVTSYDVYRDGTYLGNTSGLSFSDSGLAGSTTYSYTVDAQDAAGNVSAASTPFVVVTPAPPDTQPPTAPTGLAKTASTMTTLTLGWTAATDNVGVVSYEVYRNGVAIGPSTTLSFTDVGLSPGTSYTYTVTAADAAGNVSPASTGFVASTSSDTQPPTIPAGLKVLSTTSNSVSLSWSAATDNVAVTGYDVFRNGVKIASPASTSYTDSGLAAGTSYSYTVDARDAAGNASAVSSAVSGTTTAAFSTWYVDASGITPGSTTTIAAAYAKANPGDVVLIEPGTYKESLDLTRSGTSAAPITLQAATAGTVILDGGNSLSTAIYGTATYIDLVGLTVQHYKGTSYQNEEAAIRTASGWILSNDTVQLNSGTGIGVFGNGISLTGVIAQNNGVNGIGGSAATNVTLINCTSQGNNTGVYFTNHDPTDEGGGGKWANCNGLTFINYHGDNNCGPGLWFDWENSNITLTNCEASGNHGGGPTSAPDWVGAPVMIEANYGPVNVTNFTAAYSNSGPFGIFETPNVTVTQSSLLSGLSFRTLNRGVAALVDNNDVVTHNTILFVDLNGNAPTNLTLDYNNYQAETGYAFFYWTNNSSYTTLAALQAATKFELHGTLTYVVYS